jgi:hypothetical protein
MTIIEKFYKEIQKEQYIRSSSYPTNKEYHILMYIRKRLDIEYSKFDFIKYLNLIRYYNKSNIIAY